MGVPFESISTQEKIFYLALSQAHHAFVNINLTVAFATVPAIFRCIRDQIVYGKAVVAINVIEALIGAAGFLHGVGEKIRTAVKPGEEIPERSRIAFHKMTHRSSKPLVPLSPSSAWETWLAPAFTQFVVRIFWIPFPRFRDEARIFQLRIGSDISKDRRILKIDGTVRPSRKDRCQVESETVHMHLPYPVTEAVNNQLPHRPVRTIQRVAGTRKISIRVLGIS